jgi:hypothetical protein
MTVWISLLAGVLIGWLIEWIVDWVYWRRGAQAFYAMEYELRRELAAAQESVRAAQAEIESLRARLAELQPTAPENAPPDKQPDP